LALLFISICLLSKAGLLLAQTNPKVDFDQKIVQLAQAYRQRESRHSWVRSIAVKHSHGRAKNSWRSKAY